MPFRMRLFALLGILVICQLFILASSNISSETASISNEYMSLVFNEKEGTLQSFQTTTPKENEDGGKTLDFLDGVLDEDKAHLPLWELIFANGNGAVTVRNSRKQCEHIKTTDSLSLLWMIDVAVQIGKSHTYTFTMLNKLPFLNIIINAFFQRHDCNNLRDFVGHPASLAPLVTSIISTSIPIPPRPMLLITHNRSSLLLISFLHSN